MGFLLPPFQHPPGQDQPRKAPHHDKVHGPYNVVTAACVDLAQLAVDNPGDMELLHRIEQVSADLVTFTDALHKDVQTLLAGRTPTEMGLAELSSDQSERCQVIGKPRTQIAI